MVKKRGGINGRGGEKGSRAYRLDNIMKGEDQRGDTAPSEDGKGGGTWEKHENKQPTLKILVLYTLMRTTQETTGTKAREFQRKSAREKKGKKKKGGLWGQKLGPIKLPGWRRRLPFLGDRKESRPGKSTCPVERMKRCIGEDG